LQAKEREKQALDVTGTHVAQQILLAVYLDTIAHQDKTKQGTTLSRESMKHLKSLLSGTFAHAKRQGYFDGVNPVRDTAIPPSPKGGDTYAYSLEEITRMLMLLPEPAATIVATAAFTGARRGELRGMRWENFHDGAIYIENSIWESHVLDPKTRASKAPIPVIATYSSAIDNGSATPSLDRCFPQPMVSPSA
jgi:integrase